MSESSRLFCCSYNSITHAASLSLSPVFSTASSVGQLGSVYLRRERVIPYEILAGQPRVGERRRVVASEPLCNGGSLMSVAVGAEDGVLHHLLRNGAEELLGKLRSSRRSIGSDVTPMSFFPIVGASLIMTTGRFAASPVRRTEELSFVVFFYREFEREAQRAIQLEVTESPFVHATQDTSALDSTGCLGARKCQGLGSSRRFVR